MDIFSNAFPRFFVQDFFPYPVGMFQINMVFFKKRCIHIQENLFDRICKIILNDISRSSKTRSLHAIEKIDIREGLRDSQMRKYKAKVYVRVEYIEEKQKKISKPDIFWIPDFFKYFSFGSEI